MFALFRPGQADRWSPVPGPVGALSWLRAITYYIHVALATIVLGIWGIPKVIRHGRDGAHQVATRWTGYMLLAARWHLGLVVEIRGNPPTDDCIIAAKHQSFLDILAIAHAVPERAFIMKREVLRVPIMGWYAHKAGCIPIDRTKGRDAMRQILHEIEARRSGEGLGQLIIYPEGTRTAPGEHRPYKHGVATIEHGTGLPCIPVAVNVGLFWSKRGIPMRPGRAVIEFLPAMPQGLTSREMIAALEQVIETNSDRLLAEAGFTG